jgi:hypothetical protein
MSDDELRTRLARLDPQASAPVDPITSPRAHELLERIMTTDANTDELTVTSPHTPTSRRTRRAFALGAAAAGVAAAVAVGVVVSQGGTSTVTTPPAKKTTLALSVPGGGASTAMCLPFSIDILKTIPVAFAGTVTSVEGETVTLDVTKWYAGGSAQVVTLTNPGGNGSVALDGTSFDKGKDYLVSADQGNVSACGYSGEATAELTKAYTKAYGG